MKKKKEIKQIKPEFYVIDKMGYFFAGFEKGELKWSKNISDARELTQPQHFINIQRWEHWREPVAEYLSW